MLSALKVLGIIKRKRSFKVFDSFEDKEEKKDLNQKRETFMEDNSNNKITDWLIQKTPKKIKIDKQVKKIEIKMNQDLMIAWK